jgi:predicted RNase H-like HicB family nuclease
VKLTVLLHPEADGGYSARIPALPGCHSQGDTLDEAITNIREAAEHWMEAQKQRAAEEAKQEPPDAQLQEIEL